jgi:hypothetical protein
MKPRISLTAVLTMATTALVYTCSAQSLGSSSVRTDAADQSQNGQGGGNVLPPDANFHGYSLNDMAKLMALFDTSGNDLRYYPKTPFQILYGDPGKTVVTSKTCPQPPGGDGILVTGGNTFVVKSGTPFFVPLQEYDDSPVVVGIYPTHSSQVADYVFGPAGYGGRNYQVIVDGNKTKVGPEFLAGPIESSTPLLNGGGTHSIQLGTFLTPMTVGTHTVTITGEVASTAIQLAYGIGCVAQDYTYLVKVLPGN